MPRVGASCGGARPAAFASPSDAEIRTAICEASKKGNYKMKDACASRRVVTLVGVDRGQGGSKGRGGAGVLLMSLLVFSCGEFTSAAQAGSWRCD